MSLLRVTAYAMAIGSWLLFWAHAFNRSRQFMETSEDPINGLLSVILALAAIAVPAFVTLALLFVLLLFRVTQALLLLVAVVFLLVGDGGNLPLILLIAASVLRLVHDSARRLDTDPHSPRGVGTAT
jgi:uncharacterized membrane protein